MVVVPDVLVCVVVLWLRTTAVLVAAVYVDVVDVNTVLVKVSWDRHVNHESKRWQ